MQMFLPSLRAAVQHLNKLTKEGNSWQVHRSRPIPPFGKQPSCQAAHQESIFSHWLGEQHKGQVSQG